MASRPMLTGSVQARQEQPDIPDFKATVIDLDPEGWAALSPTDRLEVGETFFKNHFENNPDFQAMPETDRQEVRQTFFSNHITPQRNLEQKGFKAIKTGIEAQINHFRNSNPVAANVYDALTPFQGVAEGALQGLSAGGYDPQEQANESLFRKAQRSAGQFAGSAAGFLGLTPVVGPAAAGGIYGGSGSLNQQADEGRNLQNMNWNRVGGQTLLGAGTGMLPATFGGRLPVRIATGAALGGVLNSAGIAVDQLGEQGRIDLSDPAYVKAFIQGAGLGAGSAVLGGPGKVKPSKPISMAQIRKSAPPLQAHITQQARPVPTQSIQQARQRLADFKKGQELTLKQQKEALRQAAIDLHEMLKSDDPNERIQAQALKKQFEQQAADKYSRTTPGKIRKPGSPYAKRVLAELEIYKDQQTRRASFQAKAKHTQDAIVGVGIRMRKTAEGAAKFDAEISKRFSPDEKKIIMGRIKDTENRLKEAAAKNKAKAITRREKGVQKRNEINRQRQEQRQKAIKAENQRIKAELEKQKAELADARQRQKLAAMPKVLTAEQIEAHAEKLLKAHKEGRKGSVDGELARLRGVVRKDHAKNGLISKDRSDAIQNTHAKVLDRFYQKKDAYEAELKTAPKEKLQGRIQAKEENMKELEAIKAAGGDYNLQTGRGKQKPIRPDRMTWEEASEFLPKDDPARLYGEVIAEAMRKDGDVTIRYDSERSGDTGSFEYKRVSPIDFSFNYSKDGNGNIIDTKLVFHGVNENGHTGEYYLQPSDTNPKTGTISAVLEEPILHRNSFGKARRNGDGNVYFGPRDFKVAEMLARPARKTAGLTSQLQAKYLKAKQLLESVESNRAGGDIETVPASAINKLSRQSKALQDIIAKDHIDPAELKTLADDLDTLDPESKRMIDRGVDC